jgi:hypothetical protein
MPKPISPWSIRALGACTLVAVIAVPTQAQLQAGKPEVLFNDELGEVSLTRRTEMGVTAKGAVVMLAATREALFIVNGVSPARRIGRRGAGPGEYLRISGFGWLGDTLWISDEGTSRITFLTAGNLDKVRTQLFRPAAMTRAFMTQPLALTPDGKAICGLLSTGAMNAMDLLQSEPLARVSRDGKSGWDTLMLLDVRHRTHEVMNGKVKITATQLMSDASLWAISRNGKFSLSVDRSDDASTSLRPIVVVAQRTDKRPLFRVELPSPRVRTTQSDVDRLLKAKVHAFNMARTEDWIPPVTAATYGRNMFIPRFRIPVTEAIIGDDGTALLRGNDWNGATVTYTWIKPDGTRRGTFDMPVRQFVRAVSGNWIWSIEEDEDGGARLVRQEVR